MKQRQNLQVPWTGSSTAGTSHASYPIDPHYIMAPAAPVTRTPEGRSLSPPSQTRAETPQRKELP